MIYVKVEVVKAEDEGFAGVNDWHDTDDVGGAVALGLARFHRLWDEVGNGRIVTYRITVAPEASPCRTVDGARLPVEEAR